MAEYKIETIKGKLLRFPVDSFEIIVSKSIAKVKSIPFSPEQINHYEPSKETNKN